MPKFSEAAAERLSRAHPLLQKLMNAAILEFDFTILQSQRGRADQEAAFRKGHTKVHFGNSAHNWAPAVALDIAPLPIDWDDAKDDGRDGHAIFRHMQMNIIRPLAQKLHVPIRLGCDWNGDGNAYNESFIDLPHVELHPWRVWAKKSKPFEG
jgi:peptidoglycan L-alanyl-D-glutamate endopeptidase CwlK